MALNVASIWSSGPTAHIGNDNLDFGDFGEARSFGLLGDRLEFGLLGDRLEFVERRRTVSCEGRDFRSTSCHLENLEEFHLLL